MGAAVVFAASSHPAKALLTSATLPAGGTPSANVRLGERMAARYGWTGAQWSCLHALWARESGWNNRAENPKSGAYGIAQALGHGPSNQYPAGPANPPTSPRGPRSDGGSATSRAPTGHRARPGTTKPDGTGTSPMIPAVILIAALILFGAFYFALTPRRPR